jgi:hypothetical protein
LQEIGKNLQDVLEEVQKFKEMMSTLPPTKNMVAIIENRNLYLDINQIRVEQQDLAQNVEMLQEEVFQVTDQLDSMQGIVKWVVQENAKKMKTHITTETVEENL